VQALVNTVTAPRDDDASARDLFSFANALAALLGGAVVVEDARSTLLAYSNLDQPIDEARRQTILGRGNPPSWSQLLEDTGYANLLASAPGPIRITDPDGRASDRVATLVRAGGEVLGSIWVVAGESPLRPDAEELLRDATPLAALQLLRHRERFDVSRRERGQAFRALLGGEVDAAARLGITDSTPCLVVSFRIEAPDDVELAVTRHRVVGTVTIACEAFHRTVVCAWMAGTVYALFPEATPGTASRLASIAEDICRRASQSLGIEVTAGISDVHRGVVQVGRCRDEADRVLTVIDRRPGTVTSTFDEVRIPAVLLAVAELVRARDDLRIPGVQRLAQDDGKNYLSTLQAYLDSGGSIPGAAAALGIHANTMRYRLQRIEEISGLDLGNAEHRVAAALELLALS
jgi:sugar diacid utilization regulator